MGNNNAHAHKARNVVLEHMHIASYSGVNFVAPLEESELQQNKNELTNELQGGKS